MRLKLKRTDLLLILTCLLLINIPYISHTANNIFVLCTELFLILCFRGINIGILRDNRGIILYALVVSLSTLINLGISTRTATALVTGLRYILLFYAMLYFGKRQSIRSTLSVFIRFLTIMVALADLSLFATLFTSGVSEHGGVYNTYIIGDKFVVCYYHMFFLALYQLDLKKWKGHHQLKFLALTLVSISVCCIMECNTGIIGCAVVALFRVLSVKKNALTETLSKPLVFCLAFVVSNFIWLGTDFLLSDNFITDLLIKYSHTSKILTGRLEMYMIALNEFGKSPLIGHGINCTIVEDLMTWGNAQNGLLKMALDHGVLGVVSFLWVCYDSLSKKTNVIIDLPIKYGLLSFLYGMLVCSLVEINISTLFIVAFALYNSAMKSDVYPQIN